jgi:hypothetical protein
MNEIDQMIVVQMNQLVKAAFIAIKITAVAKCARIHASLLLSRGFIV